MYLIKLDDVPRNKRILEFLDNVASLIVLKEANDRIEQKQAGNDTQIDPVLQGRSQHERQLEKSCQPKDDWHEDG